MKDVVLQQFRLMAETLSGRKHHEIRIELKNGSVLNARYDPLFNTIVLGSSTFPVEELAF